jgi:hypothetical protein
LDFLHWENHADPRQIQVPDQNLLAHPPPLQLLASNIWYREFDLDLEGRPREFRKIQKMEKHCMESWWVMYHLGKIPNMACQGFTGELFHKEVLPSSSLGLPCQVTMVCASFTANYGTMVPFERSYWAPCVVLVINDNPYGLMVALSYMCRTCP